MTDFKLLVWPLWFSSVFRGVNKPVSCVITHPGSALKLLTKQIHLYILKLHVTRKQHEQETWTNLVNLDTVEGTCSSCNSLQEFICIYLIGLDTLGTLVSEGVNLENCSTQNPKTGLQPTLYMYISNSSSV